MSTLSPSDLVHIDICRFGLDPVDIDWAQPAEDRWGCIGLAISRVGTTGSALRSDRLDPAKILAIALIGEGHNLPHNHPLAHGGLDEGVCGLIALWIDHRQSAGLGRHIIHELSDRLYGRAVAIDVQTHAADAETTACAPSPDTAMSLGFTPATYPPGRYRRDLNQAGAIWDKPHRTFSYNFWRTPRPAVSRSSEFLAGHHNEPIPAGTASRAAQP